MACIKLLLGSASRTLREIGDKRQAVEILTRLRYGVDRYGDVMTPKELDAGSDAFDAVVHSSNAVVMGIPGWFATSEHDWSSSMNTPVPGTDGQICHDVNLWAELHHPHIQKFFGACHVGKEPFVIHDRSFRVYEFGVLWAKLLGCAHGLKYAHGRGLVHLNLTVNDLLESFGGVGVLRGLNLVRRSEVSKRGHLLKDQQPSTEGDILAFGLCIFYLLDEERNWSNQELAPLLTRSNQLSKQLPVDRPESIEEEEWELLSLMCSPDETNRIGILDVLYRMELLADHEDLENSKNDTGKTVTCTTKIGSWNSLQMSTCIVRSKLQSNLDCLLCWYSLLAVALLEFEARNDGEKFSALSASHPSSTLPKWFIPSYQVELGRHIADGSFGSVYEGKWLGTDVVVKRVMTDQRNAENRRQFLREVDLWFSLSDKYLVKLYGACHVGQPFFVCERAIGGH